MGCIVQAATAADELGRNLVALLVRRERVDVDAVRVVGGRRDDLAGRVVCSNGDATDARLLHPPTVYLEMTLRLLHGGVAVVVGW